MSQPIQIMKTGHIYKLDMAAAALKEGGIPHFLRQESASGLRLAMPVCPTMGPGIWWAILVPSDHLDAARKILAEMPFEITQNPEVWDCLPPGRARRFQELFIKIFALIFLIPIGIGFLALAALLIKSLLR